MSTTLPLFWHLSSSSKTDRIDAAVKLVGALEQFQVQFTPPPESSSDNENEKGSDPEVPNDKLDGSNAPDVSYSIRRLVRGLASPRESSRLGFAVALTELLSRLNTVSASQILFLLSQVSQVHGSMKGQEERDMLFARLFGITSVTQSAILFRSTPLSMSSTPACTFDDFRRAMTMLLALPSKKSFLREPSYWTFVLALRALDSSQVEWKADGWLWVRQRVFLEDKAWSPEKVGVTLIMQCLGVKEDWKLLLAPTFKTGEILSPGSLRNLAKILADMDTEDPDPGAVTSKVSTVWRPQLHWVWDLIFNIYYPTAGTPPRKLHPRALFPEFFRTVVDDYLFAPTASDGRKLWGFEVFRLAISRVPASELPRLFTPNFMRSWVNHLSKPDRYLHKAAKLVALSLPPVINANPTAGLPLLLELIQTHGHFDRLTRTKTVESMLATMDGKGVQDYVSHLGDLAYSSTAMTSEDSENEQTATRIWIADQFFALVRNGAIPKTDEWVTDVLDFFVLHGLFSVKKKNEKSKNRWLHLRPVPTFSDDARTACRTHLLASLAELMSQTLLVKLGEDKTVRRTGVASDGELWILKTLDKIHDLEKDMKHLTRLGFGEEEAQEKIAVRDRIFWIIRKLRDVTRDRKEAAEGAALFLAGTLLYRYLHNRHEDHEDDIEACITHVTRLFPGTDQEPAAKKKEVSMMEAQQKIEAFRPMDGLVDTLIGYLKRSTAYMRVVANQVFAQMTELVDKSTINLILIQLDHRDPTANEDDNVSFVEEAFDGKSQSGSESSSSDGAEIEEDEDEDIKADPELRRKIEEALHTHGVQTATDGVDEDSGSDLSQSIMDDDQMIQFDEHLAEIFRSRAKGEGRNYTGAQREVTHVKNRVLDFVDIFIRKQPTSRLIPCFLLPLVRLIMSTGPDEKQLSDKVTAVLRSRVGKAREVPSAADLPEVRKTLVELHVMARKTHSAEVRETISACSIYLTRVLLSGSMNDVEAVVDVYRASLEDFTTRKASPLQPGFFQDFVRRHPKAAWQMRDDLIQLADKAVNGYRKCQTVLLLLPLLNQLSLASENHSEIEEFIRKLQQGVYAIVSDACDGAESLSASQVKELLKLCLVAVRQYKRFRGNTDDVQGVSDIPTFVDLSSKIDSSRFKTTSLKDLCKQLHSVIGTDSKLAVNGGERTKEGSQKKRKVDETMDVANIRNGRRKKSKKNTD